MRLCTHEVGIDIVIVIIKSHMQSFTVMYTMLHFKDEFEFCSVKELRDRYQLDILDTI